MKSVKRFAVIIAASLSIYGTAFAAAEKPNILFIMGDDIGIMNVGAYHQGLMVGETPNIDRLATEGARFMT
jgi:arylsulfatase